MEAALDALRDRSLSLTRASEKFGIPPTTLWQVTFTINNVVGSKDFNPKIIHHNL